MVNPMSIYHRHQCQTNVGTITRINTILDECHSIKTLLPLDSWPRYHSHNTIYVEW